MFLSHRFNKNEYQPNTQNGRELIAHELTHVIQQQGNIMRQINENGSESSFDYWSPEDDDDVRELTEFQLANAPPIHKSRMIKLLISGWTGEEDQIQIRKILEFAASRNQISSLDVDWEDIGDDVGWDAVRSAIGNVKVVDNETKHGCNFDKQISWEHDRDSDFPKFIIK